jgi:phenylpropionate dioxygenase-like ring-hydroxylating dioxygenase large terminal subunit
MNIHVNDWDRRGLPAWTYHSQALLDLEIKEILLRHWQIVGHVSDVPKAGDYLSFDLGPERAFVLRQQDGSLRAFHNLCRHRGSRIVTGDQGHCKNALGLPLPRLGLQFRWHAARCGAARQLPRSRQAQVRPETGGA